MKTKTAWIIFILILIFGLVPVAVAVKKRKAAIASIPTPTVYPIPVEWTTIKSGTLRDSFSYVGTVKPYKYATVSTKIPGTVLKVYKKEGDVFHKGELLARIDSSEITNNILALENAKRAKEDTLPGLKAKLKFAEIALKNAKKEFNRESFLFKRGAVPERVVEGAENQLAAAKSNLKTVKSTIEGLNSSILSIGKQVNALKDQLKYTEIRAVDDGVVAEVLSYEGDMALVGKPIMKVYYPKYGFRVLVNVPPEDAKEMPVGSSVFINGKEVGKLIKYYPAANSINSLYVAEVRVDRASNLKPGENVTLKILGSAYEGQLVPIYSILHMKDGDYVLAIGENGQVKPVKVKVLKTVEGQAVISSNLQEGTKLVVGRESKLLEVFRRGKAIPSEKFKSPERIALEAINE